MAAGLLQGRSLRRGQTYPELSSKPLFLPPPIRYHVEAAAAEHQTLNVIWCYLILAWDHTLDKSSCVCVCVCAHNKTFFCFIFFLRISALENFFKKIFFILLQKRAHYHFVSSPVFMQSFEVLKGDFRVAFNHHKPLTACKWICV